jgi:hypothetical protein
MERVDFTRSGVGPTDIITPAIKYVQCGHSPYRQGGFSAAARRNPFLK